MTRRLPAKPVLYREEPNTRTPKLLPNVERFERRRRRASVLHYQRSTASRTRSNSSGISSAATAPTTRFNLRSQRHFLRSGKERIIDLQLSSSAATRLTASMSSSKNLWRDERHVKRLIELVIAEFNTDRVKNGKLGAPNYEYIAAIVGVDVPMLDAQKVKTKLDNMRKEFRMFEDLKKRTGFGWDPEKKTVTADTEHWAEVIQKDEKYAKFMGRGLQHYEDLCYIFGNNTASGIYRYAPAQDPATSDEEQRLCDEALGRAARSNLPRADSPFTPGEGSSGRRKRPSPTLSGVESRKMRSGESLNDSFEEASENFLRVRAERMANSNFSRRSLVDQCVDALMAIQPPISDEAMGRAMDKIIQSATFRQAFMRLPESARRTYVLYLK